ncbi:MAG: bifunctional metallophosphatase/5'-nucleotidase [Anaerolineae bacterium]|nr:bifunctional metallophosphatase/5'-nucleotidase [Anaerolineae bacterium]
MSPTDKQTRRLHLVRGTPNPNGARDAELYLLKGDAATEPVDGITCDDGVSFPPAWQYDHQPFRLKVLHFNDLHGNISQVSRRYGNNPIFSRMVSYIGQARMAAEHTPNGAVLVFSCGDDIIGSPYDTLVGAAPNSYQVHAGYHFYSHAGVDAGLLGNHEFDLGTRLLAHAIRTDAHFPLLSANLSNVPSLKELYSPAAIFVVKGLRVGVIGLTTPAEMRIREGAGSAILNPLPIAQNLVPALKPLTDVLIILSHLGKSLNSATAPVRDAGDMELANSLPYGSVDLIIGAHTHDAMNETGLQIENVVNGIPIVQAGYGGRYLGEAHIAVRKAPAVLDAHLNFTANMPVDETFERAFVEPLLEKIQPVLKQPLGRVTVGREIIGDAVCDDCAYGESALHNLITDGLLEQYRALGNTVNFAVLDSAGLRADLEPDSELTYGDWLRVMPYADTLVVRQIGGAELKALIQDNARRIDISGQPHIDRGFLHFSQEIRYVVRMGERRSQITAEDITVNGVPIEQLLDDNFTFICTSFLRGFAARWEEQTAKEMALFIINARVGKGSDTGLFVRDLMLEHLKKHGGITEPAGARHDGRLQVAPSGA